MIYLNNAATTYTKPQSVLNAHSAALCALPAGQFRSAADENRINDNVLERCRELLGRLLGIRQKERIFFAGGATDAANALIGGLALEGKQIITTASEHNCVLRTLLNHEKIRKDDKFTMPGIEDGYPVCSLDSKIIIVPCDKEGYVSPEELENYITADTGAVIVNHCSNVTGKIQNMEAIGKITRQHEVLFLADVSQSAGCIPVKADEWGIDGLVFTGHKSLFGVQGTGGYYIRKGIPFLPYRFGGTGRDSAQLIYKDGDYEYEPGTQNYPGAAALCAGIEYILGRGVEKIHESEMLKMKKLYAGLAKWKAVTLYGNTDDEIGPVLSFNMKGLKASDTAYILQNGYDIVVRSGLHCAPLVHHFMGTKKWGTVRVSISDFTSDEEIYAFLEAAEEINATLT